MGQACHASRAHIEIRLGRASMDGLAGMTSDEIANWSREQEAKGQYALAHLLASFLSRRACTV
jgi:hypothetical protein